MVIGVIYDKNIKNHVEYIEDNGHIKGILCGNPFTLWRDLRNRPVLRKGVVGNNLVNVIYEGVNETLTIDVDDIVDIIDNGNVGEVFLDENIKFIESL